AQGPGAAGLSAGESATPVLVAEVRWQGQPAVVLVYVHAGGLVGVVMRAGDCVRLATLTL
ncbi:MAG: hypothetical protein M3N98_08780, partial [Actinomycetota bacterium]|nr:hypothetical protein [Actinomycetota bacterium]